MAGSLSHEFREAAGELRKFVPVRVVSYIEGCLKAGTARLINHGDPYRGILNTGASCL